MNEKQIYTVDLKANIEAKNADEITETFTLILQNFKRFTCLITNQDDSECLYFLKKDGHREVKILKKSELSEVNENIHIPKP